MKIVLNRIDDRLIHGQLLATWVKKLSVKRIVVIDDQMAGDKFLKQIFLMSVPPHVRAEVYDIIQGGTYLLRSAEKMDVNTIVLMRSPKTMQELWNLGYRPKELNLGGLSATASRHTIGNGLFYISDEEIEILKHMMNAGTHIFVQRVCAESKIDFKQLISNL